MCGLAGVLDSDTRPDGDLRDLAARMADRLRHRGPDAAGVWGEAGVALSHRRLAIVDLSQAGAQPMLSACGRYCIVFNGEIYNHADLRRDLAQEGVTPDWRGHSDTETLLAGIVHWGFEATLQRCAGMFAIALWDRSARRLTLARDRMGEKPLYWGWAGAALVFGSELKALRVHPDCPSGVCADALALYLRFGYVPAPRSIHPGLFKLEPGCLLEVDAARLPLGPPANPLRPGQSLGGVSIRRYWSLDTTIAAGAAEPVVGEADAIALTEATLGAAVGRQMMADVPLGAFLSGGIDSSLIVALMQARSDRRVRTFTVGFEVKAFDESPFAAAVAQHLGTDHSTLIVTEAEARDVIPDLPDLYDEPFADSSQIPTHLVCRAARAGVTVALSGDGGDELFGGYNRYILGPQMWRRIAPVPFALRKGLSRVALAVPESGWNMLGRFHNALRPPAAGIAALGQKVHRVAERLRRVETVDGLYRDITSIWPEPKVLMVQDHGARAGAALEDGPLHDPLPACLDDDPAGRMMAMDLCSYLPDDILCKVDRAAMGISLETRVPFLDPAVVALSARIPADLKVRGGQGKWLLRQVLFRHVPKDLIERPKTGFSVPLGAWLRGPLRGWAEDLLSPASLAQDGLLNPEPIRAAWAEHLTGHVDRSAQLWVILMFMAWRDAERCTR